MGMSFFKRIIWLNILSPKKTDWMHIWTSAKLKSEKVEQLLTAFASHLLASWQTDSSAAPRSQSAELLSRRQDDSHLQPTANKTEHFNFEYQNVSFKWVAVKF